MTEQMIYIQHNMHLHLQADSGDRWLTVEFHSSVVKYQRSGLEFQVKKKIPGLEHRRLMAAWTAATINCH